MLGAALVLASVSLLLPSLSAGSVTIGSDLTAGGELIDHNCGGGCTVVQTALPGRQLTAPFSGLIVRWRERSYAPGTATLRVVSFLSSLGPPWTTSFLRSSVAEPTGGLGVVTFPVSPPLPISAGDTIGVTGPTNNIQGAFGATGATDTVYAEESPLDGTTVNSTNIKGMNDDWLYNADVVAAPTSTGAATACPGGSMATVTVTADPDPATAPKAAHFSIDGGPEQTVATSGNPGVATIVLPNGVHTLEFWGEDLLGQKETSRHAITAGCPPTPPLPGKLSATGPQPVLTHVTQTHGVWREGSRLAQISRRRPPTGTVFSFALNEPAAVRLTFTQSGTGRKVGGQCVPQTQTNRTSHTCKGALTRGALAFTAHTGTNRVTFQGRISSSQSLKLGFYTLVIAATNLAGDRTVLSRLSFTIVR